MWVVFLDFSFEGPPEVIVGRRQIWGLGKPWVGHPSRNESITQGMPSQNSKAAVDVRGGVLSCWKMTEFIVMFCFFINAGRNCLCSMSTFLFVFTVTVCLASLSKKKGLLYRYIRGHAKPLLSLQKLVVPYVHAVGVLPKIAYSVCSRGHRDGGGPHHCGRCCLKNSALLRSTG